MGWLGEGGLWKKMEEGKVCIIVFLKGVGRSGRTQVTWFKNCMGDGLIRHCKVYLGVCICLTAWERKESQVRD